jgi:Tol biopolymer transport system component
MNRNDLASSSVTEQLERVLQSEVFRGAGRSSKLLRFLVQETLNGRAAQLKDYTLGSEALGRGEDFDPRTDPIARVEASRLRSRLELYYATAGASDSVVITLPKGGYVPVFSHRSAADKQTATPATAERRRKGAAAVAFVALIAIASGLLWWRSTREPQQQPAEMRLEITTPPTTDPISLAVSPDGQKIVFVATSGNADRLWLRRLNETSPRPLAGTDHASLPFWSPDSKSVGFFADGGLKRIEVETGLVQSLRRGSAAPGGATWNGDGLIVYAGTIDARLLSVSLEGLVRGYVTDFAPGQTGHRAPQFLPDGRHFIYFAMGTPDVRGIYVGDLDRTIARRLVDADTPAVYVAKHLLYVSQGRLFAQRFDPVRLELEGNPKPIAEEVISGTRANLAALTASSGGMFAYRSGTFSDKRQFVWFDRNGHELGRVGSPHGFGPSYAAMSPDEKRLAVQRTVDGNTDIWLLDLEHDTPMRFTTDPQADIAPIWSPGGDHIVFSSLKNHFNLYERSIAATTAQEMVASEGAKSATDWSSDGRFLLFRSLDRETNWDIWALPMSGERKAFAVVRSKFEERDGRFSPDGKWIAYQSNDTGRFEIYVQSFQGSAERRRISPDGGVQPCWSRDGRELFYIALDEQLMTVPVHSEASRIEPGTPVSLFQARVGGIQDIPLRLYNVSTDGQRFLLDTVVEQNPSPIVVVLNWKPPAD